MRKPKSIVYFWKRVIYMTLFLVCITLFSGSQIFAAAGINKQINFQGRVVNSNGTNVSNGSYTFVFNIYTASSGGSPVWTESKSLTVTDGVFRTALGDTTTLPGSVNFNTDNIYLGIEFNSDGEMSPRIRFTASPYAFNADAVDGIEGDSLLRSDATDSYTGTGTLSFATGTTLDINSGATLDVNGQLSISDTDIALDGASANIISTGDFSVNTDDLFIKKSNGTVGIGTTSPISLLHVTGSVIGKALAIFNESGDQNIFEASASGVPKLSITRTGSIVFEGSTNDTIQTILAVTDPTASDKTITLPNASGTVAVSASGAISLSAAGDISCSTCLASGGSLFSITGSEAGTVTVSQGNTITIGGGTGIDTTPSGSTVNVVFDATEIGNTTWGTASSTWTFEAGATDPSILFASDAFTFTAGTSTFSGNVGVNGGSLTTSASTFNLANTATTLNLGSTNVTRAINIGTGTNADTISIGTGGTTADVINIGTAATANTIAIGSSSSTTVSITDDNWSISTAGLFTTADDAAINGGDITTTSGTFNLANAATTLNLGSTAVTRAINIGTGTNADTINIGTGGTTADTINIGTAATANTIAIGSSSSTTVSITDDNWSITTAGLFTTADDLAVNGGDLTTTSGTFNLLNAATTLNIGSSAVTRAINIGTGINADTINIGTGGTVADTINIGTAATANTIAIGSSSSTTVSITDDNWSITAAGLFTTADDAAINGGDITTTSGTFNLANAATTLNLGSTAVTRAINIGTGTNADTINIGTGGTTADTINIGTAATANTIAIGSSSVTNLSLTDNNWNISTAGAANFVSLGATTAGSGAFTTLTASGNVTFDSTTLFVDSTNDFVGIGFTSPATKLDIDTGSNTLGLRLRGTAETTEIADLFVDNLGALVLDLTAGADTSQYLDIRPEDNDYGLILRNSATGGTTQYANFYMNDAATDYLNIAVNATNATTGLVIDDSDNIGMGTTTPQGKLHIYASAIPIVFKESDAAAGVGYWRLITDSGVMRIDMNTAASDTFGTYGNPISMTSTIVQLGGATSQGGAWTPTMTIANNNGFVGIGTTNPIAKFEVAGGDFIVSGGNDYSGDQGTMVTNGGFELNADGTTTVSDTWGTQNVSGTPTYSVTTTAAQGDRAQEITVNNTTGRIYSQCFPVSASNTYTMTFQYKVNTGTTNTITYGLEGSTTKANCTARTKTDRTASPSPLTGTSTTFVETTSNVAVGSTDIWARAFIQFNSTTSRLLTVDSVTVIPQNNTDGIDIAENFPVNPDEKLEAGEIVSFSNNQDSAQYVTRTQGAYDKNILGVVSTKPGITLDTADQQQQTRVPVALNGRVPVKVSIENGPIAIGDYITSSSIPGVGMRQTEPGITIGRALTSYNSDELSARGEVTIFVSTAQVIPPIYLTSSGNVYGGSGVQVLDTLVTQGTTLDEFVENVGLVTSTEAGDTGLMTVNGESQTLLKVLMKKNEKISFTQGNEDMITFDASGNGYFAGLLFAKHIKAETIEGTLISSAAAQITTSSQFSENGVASVEGLVIEKNATVSAQLHVGGSTLIEGILNVIDSITTGNLIVGKWADFIGSVIFRGDVNFVGRPTFNKDTAGFAVIKKDSQRVEIVFDKEYTHTPTVNITLSYDDAELGSFNAEQVHAAEQMIIDSNYQYFISKLSTKGFTIVLNKSAQQDLKFSWTALATLEQKITESAVSVVPTVLVPEQATGTPPASGSVSITPTATIIPEEGQVASVGAATE